MKFEEAVKGARNKKNQYYVKGVMITPIIRWDLESRTFLVRSIRTDGTIIQAEKELVLKEQYLDDCWGIYGEDKEIFDKCPVCGEDKFKSAPSCEGKKTLTLSDRLKEVIEYYRHNYGDTCEEAYKYDLRLVIEKAIRQFIENIEGDIDNAYNKEVNLGITTIINRRAGKRLVKDNAKPT